MKAELVDKMDKRTLNQTAKKFGLKISKLSVMQIREALKAAGDEPAPKVKAKRERAEGPRPGSKAEKALAIWKDNKDKPRQELLKLFQTKAGLTVAGSNTYLANIQKKYGSK